MDYTGERYIPDTITLMALEHQHRYLWAQRFAAGKQVLDIACGEGYGSDILSRTAKKVYGCDVSKEAVEWARKKYAVSDIDFEIMDIGNIKFENEAFDLITCFETIEHVSDEAAAKAVKDFARVLKKDGILLISTPSTESPLHCKHNRFHTGEMSYEVFRKKLEAEFEYVYILSQSVYCSSVIGDGVRAQVINFNDASDYKYEPQNDKYLIAVCSNNPLDNLDSSILIDRTQGSLKQLTRIKNFLSFPIAVYNFFMGCLACMLPLKSWRKKINALKW